MRSRLLRVAVAASLIGGNATLARALTTESAAKSEIYQICVWICTQAGTQAQGCDDWLFTSCGEDRCGDPPGSCT
jgi:hypothetical protein